MGERLTRAAITATVLGCVARYLEPAGFGRLNFAFTLVVIANALAVFGLEGVVVNELVRQPDRAGAVLGTALRLRFAAGGVSAALLNLLAWTLPDLRPDAPLISRISLILLLQPVEVVDLWFQRHLDSRRTVVARFMGIAAGATLKLWLVASHASLAAFAWAYTADVAFIALSLAWAGARSPHSTGAWQWDPAVARQLWQRGAPLAFSALVIAFTLRLDQLLVRHWLGEARAGIYFAGTRLTEMAGFAGAAIGISLFPGLAAAHARSAEEFMARLRQLFEVLSALGWVVALVGTLGSPWIIRLLYGPAYADTAPVFVLQVWACLVALNTQARWNFIILSAPTLINLGAALFHVVTLATTATLLIPRWGAAGAAMSLLAANLVSGLGTTFLFPALRPCAEAQVRGLLIPFQPQRWPGLVRAFQP